MADGIKYDGSTKKLSLTVSGSESAIFSRNSTSGSLYIKNFSNNPVVEPAIMMAGINNTASSDIKTISNSGSIRLIASPNNQASISDAAAIQVFGNGSPYSGSVYIDAGSGENANIVLRASYTSLPLDNVLSLNYSTINSWKPFVANSTLNTATANQWNKAQGSEEVFLASSFNTCSIDFNASNYYSILLQENTFFETIDLQSNIVGASGIITIRQDNSVPYTISFSSDFKFPSGVDKTMSTGLSSISILVYTVQSSQLFGSKCLVCNLLKDIT